MAALSYFPESHPQSEISSFSKVILFLGKARSYRALNLGCRGPESPGHFFFLMTETKKYLKPQLLEEPFVLAGLVPLFEPDLGLLSGLAFQSRVSEDVLDDSFIQRGYPQSGHEVIVVMNFHKRLDLRSLGGFLLAHGTVTLWG